MTEQKPNNLLDLVLERLVECERGEDGHAVLLIPKYRSGLLAKYLQPRLKRPYHRIHLDAFGTYVWDSMDGVKTVEAVAAGLKEAHGEEVEPVFERVGLFMNTLLRNRLARIREPGGSGSPG